MQNRLDHSFSIDPMSRSSRDYYSSSRGTTLPPIRDVIGDVLAQPVRPEDSSSRHRSQTPGIPAHSPSPTSTSHLAPMHPPQETDSPHYRSRTVSSRDYRMQSPSPGPSHTFYRHDSSHPSPPPLQSSRVQDHRMQSPSPGPSHTFYRHNPSQPGPPPFQSPRGQDHRMQSPSPRPSSRAIQRQEYSSSSNSRRSHSYDVFVATSDQGLIHKRSSPNDDFHQVTKEDIIANSTGKHICAECQRRFEKLSTLKNHLTTHSGERPHECPDCGKTFSVYTNMRRHQLIHRRSETSD